MPEPKSKADSTLSIRICPDCQSRSPTMMKSLDGAEIHLICMDCNRVYAQRPSEKKGVWRDLGPYVRV